MNVEVLKVISKIIVNADIILVDGATEAKGQGPAAELVTLPCLVPGAPGTRDSGCPVFLAL